MPKVISAIGNLSTINVRGAIPPYVGGGDGLVVADDFDSRTTGAIHGQAINGTYSWNYGIWPTNGMVVAGVGDKFVQGPGPSTGGICFVYGGIFPYSGALSIRARYHGTWDAIQSVTARDMTGYGADLQLNAAVGGNAYLRTFTTAGNNRVTVAGTWADGDEARLDLTPLGGGIWRLQMYKNGVAIGSYYDENFSAGAGVWYPGLYGENDGTQWDDFSVYLLS